MLKMQSSKARRFGETALVSSAFLLMLAACGGGDATSESDGAAETIAEKIEQAADSAAEKSKELADKAGEAASEAAAKVEEASEKVSEAAAGAAESMGEAASDAKAAAGDAMNAAAEKAGEAKAAAGAAVDTVAEKAGEAASDAKAAAGDVMNAASEKASDATAVTGNAVDATTQKAGEAASSAKDVVGNAAGAAGSAVAGAAGAVAAAADKTTESAKDVATDATEATKSAVQSVTGEPKVVEIAMYSKNPENARELNVFAPDLIVVNPGDTVRFVPTNPTHQSSSIEGMVPEGATGWKGKINQPVEFVAEKPGVYGYKCVPHYAGGMVGMVIVKGDGMMDNVDSAKSTKHIGLAKRRFEDLWARAEAEYLTQ